MHPDAIDVALTEELEYLLARTPLHRAGEYANFKSPFPSKLNRLTFDDSSSSQI